MIMRLRKDERVREISAKMLNDEKSQLKVILKPDCKFTYDELENILLPYMVREPPNINHDAAKYSAISMLA